MDCNELTEVGNLIPHSDITKVYASLTRKISISILAGCSDGGKMKLWFIFECIDTMRNLKVDNGRLESLCREYNVKRLAVFGSVLKGSDNPGSDLDLLVEFEAGKTPGFAYFHLQDKLSHLFGQTVDLNTPAFLSRYFREEVLRTAQNVYVDR